MTYLFSQNQRYPKFLNNLSSSPSPTAGGCFSLHDCCHFCLELSLQVPIYLSSFLFIEQPSSTQLSQISSCHPLSSTHRLAIFASSPPQKRVFKLVNHIYRNFHVPFTLLHVRLISIFVSWGQSI